MLFIMMILFAGLAYVFERYGPLEATAAGLMLTVAFQLTEITD
ncbi:MAG: hypothetical protein JWL93_1468 [Hyphomicrobiales bacterium]|jgi:hypothetical protein|nr:hypothetical protein [Hyphomicrobiales bacterium]